jgi:hypothetical protein
MSLVQAAAVLLSTNASSSPAKVEMGLRLPEGERLIRADVVPTLHTGRPTFHVPVPAEGTAYIGYQAEQTSMRPVPRADPASGLTWFSAYWYVRP